MYDVIKKEKRYISNKRKILAIFILIPIIKLIDEVKPYPERIITNFNNYELMFFLIESFFVFYLVANVLSLAWRFIKRAISSTDSKYVILREYRQKKKEPKEEE